ncbi:coagulation factor 5/8 type, C-terminal domain-containing protein [Naegleria gruberi]|uniref:Coagulation factor 5/8 type, C-terminal domain-containing protein n=1 Tax=Naegleria gruberi TaxID=5762 RepID=D2VCI0_NAEGR|nr:coagulation factor 5/8 type, C-terminal domain-containing protein [Naegleria gruberi]EFC45420.1 coagulation factor 5/8 type, C-terminal domain-containing protein [Naegleria gruberi]|eukprot:XP_002678164.1 coagulation factor 5/8 type, C-terminal domain-containing protein [Naegleria gruberi strain NEG-M]
MSSSEGFIVAPTELIVHNLCKKSDNTIEGLLDESGDYGCSTDFINKPCVELKFDRVYQFTTLECTSNKKYYDDQQRLKGVDIYCRSNESDPWKEIYSFREGHGIQKVQLGCAARYFKFDKFGTHHVAFGRLWLRASDAPAVNIKTKTGEIVQVSNVQEVTVAENLDEPPYTEGEISVIAPSKLVLSTKDSWGNNTIEGLLDETGKHGACTSNGLKQNIVLTFDRVYLFTLLEFKTNRLGEINQYGLLQDTLIEYKQFESQEWIPLREISKSDIKLNPESTFIHFDTPVKARTFRFTKLGNGFVQLFFGMLKLFAYHPYTEIKTLSGVVSRYVSPSSVVSEPVVTQPATTTPVVSQQQTVTPVVTQTPPVAVSQDEPKYTSGEVSVIAPVELKMSGKDSWGDNTIEGLLDDSGKFGACTTNGSSEIRLIFDQVYLFTFLEFKACKLGEGNQTYYLQDSTIEYKVKESDEWTKLKTLEKSDIKFNPELNTINFTTPIKAKYWRFFKQWTHLFYGMLRMYGYAPYIAHKTKSGTVQPYVPGSSQPVVTSTPVVQQTTTTPVVSQPVTSTPVVTQTPVVSTPQPQVVQQPVVAQQVVVPTVSDEPKFTSGDINCIPPLEMKQSSKDSWGDNTLEGLFDDSGKLGVCTGNNSNQFIEIKYGAVYLFTYMEFKTSKLGESMQLSSLDNVKIEYKVKESDSWTLAVQLKRSEIKTNPQVNTIQFNTPIKARYWRFFKEDRDYLFFGMIRLFGYCDYVPIQTKSGIILSVKEALAQWEPKYTGPEINLIPIKKLNSKGESRRENTLEGLLDDTGDFGYVTTSNHKEIEFEYEHVYLFTHFEYMTLTTVSNPVYYLKDTKIEYKLKDSETWTLLTTIEENQIQITPLVNTITLPQPIKAKYLRLVAYSSCIEIGMFRAFGYSPFVPIETKSGPILPPELIEEQLKDPFPGCDQINLIKPHAMYHSTNRRTKTDPKVIDDLLRSDGKPGFATNDGTSSFIEVAFERVYNFRVLAFREHPNGKQFEKVDGWGRTQTSSIVGVSLEYKMRSRDPWVTLQHITEIKTSVQGVLMVDFGECGHRARYFRFVQTPHSGLTGTLAVGMLKFYAMAPVQNFKIGNADYSGEVKIETIRNDHSDIPKLAPANLVDPIYTESTCPDVNVVAPIKLYSSKNNNRANNTIEGIIDDSGVAGCAIGQSVHNYMVLEFEAVHLFKYLEFKKQKTIKFDDELRHRLNLYYKVQEGDAWTKVDTFDQKYYHWPKLNIWKFNGDEGITARFWKFERICGDFSFGMLQFFAVAPFVPYNTTKGLLLSRDQQEAIHMTPYRGSEINCLVPNDMMIGREDDETKTPKQATKFNTYDRAENNQKGILDDSAEYGICSPFGTLILSYTNIHFFKYIEYYTHALYNEKTQTNFCSDIRVYYRIRETEPWISFDKTIEESKPYPYLNRFEIDESSTGFKARYWKFETSNLLLLGTFRVYGFGEFVPAETRTGALLPVNGDIKKYKLQEKLKNIEAHNKLIELHEQTKYCKVCLEDLEENVDSLMDCKTCGVGLCERDAKVHKKKNPTHEISERVALQPLADEPEEEETHHGCASHNAKPTNIKDLQGLEKYYSKVIQEKFTPVTEGMGPLKQLVNDRSLLVDPVAVGSSSISIVLPDCATSKNLSERSSYTSIAIVGSRKEIILELINLRFTNKLNSPISITSMKLEYLDHDGTTWKAFGGVEAAYWEAATVATATSTNFGRDVEFVVRKSETQGQYVWGKTINLSSGSTSKEYLIKAAVDYQGICPKSYRALHMTPYDLPYPCTFRFSFTDSLNQSKSMEIVYMTPELSGIVTPQEFKTKSYLRDNDFFDECSDIINREQSFVGVKLDSGNEGIVLFNSGIKEGEAKKTYDLGQLRFRFEHSNMEETLLWEGNGDYCKAKFYLLCDPELYYRGYCIKVVAHTLTASNSIVRYYPLYEFIQQCKPLSIN